MACMYCITCNAEYLQALGIGLDIYTYTLEYPEMEQVTLYKLKKHETSLQSNT